MSMITKDVEVTISKDGTKATLAKPLQLHKGDAEVCLDIHILGIDYDFHDFDTETETVIAEINILKPNSTEFQYRAEILESNIVHFEVPSTLLDEYAEVGIHLVQIVICCGLSSRLALPTFQLTVKDKFDLDTINTMPVTPQIVTEITKIVKQQMSITNGVVDGHTRSIQSLQEDMNNKANVDHDHDDAYNKKSEKIAVEQLPDETVETLSKVREIRFVDQLPPKDQQEPDVIYFVV